MSYLPCELHCHSVHSDGSFSVAELLRRAYDDHLADSFSVMRKSSARP